MAQERYVSDGFGSIKAICIYIQYKMEESEREKFSPIFALFVQEMLSFIIVEGMLNRTVVQVNTLVSLHE